MEKGIGNLRQKLKHIDKSQWLILVLTGILLLVIAMPVPGKEETETADALQTESRQKEGVDALEERLETALGHVAGVGKVKVMIMRKSSGEKIVEKDTPVTDRSTTEEGDDGNRSSVEKVQEESTVYTQDGNGGRVPYVIEEMEPQIQGILVVAEGGDNSQVVQNITEAVMALFGVEAHKIKVMKMN
ncbi:MAG: stage III sporulation protein AG [Lachnospiraceae bacterium]|jgi:stage III sporulation protein AG|uniref:Stage III sporulation protein AG n=1 Tax=Hominisplanchenecus murintestinalis TaxID=2941517 RepID=A0AC61QYQ6_9FIRM|nr:stage III sporulation protein AG [Hominisplanchenecus murintestinalis]MCI9516461.1 stage III sporulation protein AG [Lachnospiraceae bacterium]RKJ95287.1 stage III sporulation protein AG [Anaerotruncus sp. 1XD22-93]MCI9660940.1 stage III sporulation protein AG [Lachnospiraceae bacterium]NBH97818.1 stage III sporulation protein AG [Lachnospiraceae bacterium]NBI74866.1 stage III sporulation protein AG [Lachnospiraceae bacterium]